LRKASWYRSSEISSFSRIWLMHASQTHDWEMSFISQELLNTHLWHPVKCPLMKHFNSILPGFCINSRLNDSVRFESICLFFKCLITFISWSFIQFKCLIDLVDFELSAKPGVISRWHSEHFVVEIVGISIQSVKVFESPAN
jgi:hypothetical protein